MFEIPCKYHALFRNFTKTAGLENGPPKIEISCKISHFSLGGVDIVKILVLFI
jgi:hypothetical protein